VLLSLSLFVPYMMQISQRYIARLKAMRDEGSLPPPIMFNGHFYRDGEELHDEHPQLACLI